MGEVVAVLEKQCSISTTKPSPAVKRGRKGGGATKANELRVTGRSLIQSILTFSTITKKGLKGFEFSASAATSTVSHRPLFHPPPSPIPAARLGQEPAEYVRLQTRLCQQENTASQCRVHVPSESVVLHLHGLSGLQPSPFISLQTIFRANNHIHFCSVKSLEETVPRVTPVATPTEANKFIQHDNERIRPCGHLSQNTLIFFLG